ncbi:M42 family peptidase (plasmid) [Deinococcus taeanensis]|uniref:M42 family metallopeptidase n=1 Tax=Deinococcus taeanensis TaxID=2737050 RepID=UPI001CDC054B|nr:M42 family peptidase [Deinococcus taeanensis]UBV44225.1 M42 family peptidase [Deinococcus taeanensis]
MTYTTDPALITALRARVRDLCEINAVSGDERPMLRHLRQALAGHADEFTVDTAGNGYAVKRGPRPGPTLLIAAHTDEIGLMVKSIEPDGFVRFEKIGGVIDALLPARVVQVRGVQGLIGVKAGHYQTDAERTQSRRAADLYIDLGCASAGEVRALGVQIGDPVTFVSPLVQIGPHAHLVAGKAVDNRLGCAALLELAGRCAPPCGTLVLAFTAQEEVGLKGAKLAAERFRPDLALALDTMPSGDTPDMSEHRDLNVRLGAGPALQVMAGPGGRANLLHPGVRDFLVQVAADRQVPLQLCTFSGGSNDSAAMAWAGLGYAAGSLTIPRRYSHSPVELTDLRDAAGALAILSGVTERMAALPDFAFLEDEEPAGSGPV